MAYIEATMTFLKIREESEGQDKALILDPAIAQDQSRLFHFARIYQNTLLGLVTGQIRPLKELEASFANG